MQIAGWDRDEIECADEAAVSSTANRVNAVIGQIAGSVWVFSLMAVAKLAGMTVGSARARN